MQLTSASTSAALALGFEHRLYLPDDSQAPLALLIHGRAGSHQSMNPFSNVFPQPCALLMPQAPLVDPLGGFSWWPVSAGLEEMQVGANRAAESIERFIQQALAFYNLAPSSIVALGFSQGGAVLSVVLQRGNIDLAGVGLLASFVLEQPQPRWSAALRSVFIAHGTQDTVIDLARAERGRDFLARKFEASVDSPVRLEMVCDAVGHKVGSSGMRALRAWGQAVLGCKS